MVRRKRQNRQQAKGSTGGVQGSPGAVNNAGASASNQQGSTVSSVNNAISSVSAGSAGPTTSTASNFEQATMAIAKWWLKLPVLLLDTLGTPIVLVLFGLNPLPTSPPIVEFVRNNFSVFLLIGSLLAFITLLAAITSLRFSSSSSSGVSSPSSSGVSSPSSSGVSKQRWMIAAILSMISTLLCSGWLAIVLVHPFWCPLAFCPVLASQDHMNPQSVRDSFLEISPRAIRSSLFVIPGDPSQYQSNDLPQSTAAVPLWTQSSPYPYRIVLDVHSLLQGPYHINIEQILLVVDRESSIPHPLNVWATNTAVRNDVSNLVFLVTYGGQDTGAMIIANSTSHPPQHLDLAPSNENYPGGEVDQAVIEVHSKVPIDLHFHLEVRYRIVNEDQLHFLKLTKQYEVIFSDKENWYPYVLRGGNFVPQSQLQTPEP